VVEPKQKRVGGRKNTVTLRCIEERRPAKKGFTEKKKRRPGGTINEFKGVPRCGTHWEAGKIF